MNHAFTVEPGAEFPVMAGGDFVFCNFAAHDIRVIIQDSPRTMRAGSKWRPAGGFVAGDLIVKNPDPVNPVAVVLTIGTGDFDDQIIRGEVTVNPGIRGRDGVFIDDTRSTVRLSAAFGNITPREYIAGGLVATVGGGQYTAKPTILDDGRVLSCDTTGDDWTLFRNWPVGDGESIVGLGDGSGVQVGAELLVPAGENVPGEGYRIVVNRYDAATLQFREKMVTEAPWRNVSPSNPAIYALAAGFGRYFIGQSGAVDVVDEKGVLVGELTPSNVNSPRGVVIRGGVLHVFSGSTQSTSMAIYDPLTLAALPVSESRLPEVNGIFYGYGLSQRGTLFFGGTGSLEEYAISDVTISASGTVSACAGSGRFKAGQVDTIAELYTQRLENGRVLASGQLLRAVLEIYAGRYMPNDYLDYIYAVKADNLNGISPRVIDAGGQSFAAAGIADDAAGTFPQTIEITLREGLL